MENNQILNDQKFKEISKIFGVIIQVDGVSF